MAVINPRNSTNNNLPIKSDANSSNSTKIHTTVSDDQIQVMKRKFLRVNQEVVKQNVALHDQVAKQRQEHHLILQENVRLKGKIVALENKLKESENFLHETRESVRERIEILEAIGLHIIDITKFLRLIGNEKETQPSNQTAMQSQSEMPEIEGMVANECSSTITSKTLKSEKGGLGSIAEDEMTVSNLTEQVSDVSIMEEKVKTSKASLKRGKSSKFTTEHR